MMATGQSSRIVSVGSAAGVRCARFFLHLAEFLDAIRPGSFPNMRSLRHYNGPLIKTKEGYALFSNTTRSSRHVLPERLAHCK